MSFCIKVLFFILTIGVASSTIDDTLKIGHRWSTLQSKNYKYLAIHDPSVGLEIISFKNNDSYRVVTGEHDEGPSQLIFQMDGNLVEYTIGRGADVPVWSSGTDHKDAHRIVLENDGELYMYDYCDQVIWSTSKPVKKDGKVVNDLVIHVLSGGLLAFLLSGAMYFMCSIIVLVSKVQDKRKYDDIIERLEKLEKKYGKSKLVLRMKAPSDDDNDTL